LFQIIEKVKLGTLAGLLKQAEVSPEEFIEGLPCANLTKKVRSRAAAI